MKSILDPNRLPKRRSLSRILWSRLECLPTKEQIERLITREVARAERNGLHFSLVLFRVGRGGQLKRNEKRLALALLRRVRVTDEVGWFDDHHLCAILPDTSAQSAQIFADSACELVARRCPRPIPIIYSFPFQWPQADDADDDPAGKAHDGNGFMGGGRCGRHESTDVRHRNLPDRLGLDDLAVPDALRPANLRMPTESNGHGVAGSGHGGIQLKRQTTGALALLDAPSLAPEDLLAIAIEGRSERHPNAGFTAARPAASPGLRCEVKPIHDLLVRPMPLWKRSLDLFGAVCMLLLLSPLLVSAAIAIKLTSRGPIIFKQRRAGLGGRPFTIFKFRTMCDQAEAQKNKLRRFSEQDGPAFKMKRDPRVTRVGALLRQSSIDELPQLFNVVIGDMSLVGPRPLPLDEQNAAEPWQQRRLDVTPGLTCIWQIAGRSRVTFAEWVRMDMAYMRRRTFVHDLIILLKTVPAVLLRRGAR